MTTNRRNFFAALFAPLLVKLKAAPLKPKGQPVSIGYMAIKQGDRWITVGSIVSIDKVSIDKLSYRDADGTEHYPRFTIPA